MERKSHFKSIESYKHKLAKQVLAEWFRNDMTIIREEEKFYMCGLLWFVSDISCYDLNDGLTDIYEIVWKNEVSLIKQWRIFMYMKWHNWNVRVWRIDAEWIMTQVKKPDVIKRMRII